MIEEKTSIARAYQNATDFALRLGQRIALTQIINNITKAKNDNIYYETLVSRCNNEEKKLDAEIYQNKIDENEEYITSMFKSLEDPRIFIEAEVD